MRVLAVRAGAKYSREYVLALRKQVHAGLVTLTDMPETPGVTVPLRMMWPGWWAKLELFAPWNEHLRPALYIDLDSFVFGPVDHFDVGDTFTMVEDFLGPSDANSSVMWLPRDTSEIWEAFTADPKLNMKKCGGYGDQKFLAPFAKHLWKTPDDGITSFRVHGCNGPYGTIMQFHGKPKMPDAEGWAKEYWAKLNS